MNCIETNEFVWNMPTYNQRLDVNSSALETWDDEFEVGNIKKAPSKLVRPPRVADSPVAFECRVHSIIRVANEHHGDSMFGPHLVGDSDIVIGRVLGIHVNGEYITDEGVSILCVCLQSHILTILVTQLFDVLKAAPLARLGYHQYTHINQVWDMKMPFMPDDKVSGNILSGAVGIAAPPKVEKIYHSEGEEEVERS
jgi:flavin reductase (DIM6/NTAB) family NADH-FMN oxidoreductase RutF